MPDDSPSRPRSDAPAAATSPPSLGTSDYRLPTLPFALIRDQILRHGRWRIAGLVSLALGGALIENLQP